MDLSIAGGIVGLVMVALLVAATFRVRRRRRVGAAAAGTIYDMLNEDKRNAIEVIVEERTGERDPEDRDGNLPDLGGGRRPRSDG